MSAFTYRRRVRSRRSSVTRGRGAGGADAADSRPRPTRIAARVRVVGTLSVGLLALLLVRLWSIQVVHRRRYEDEAVAISERVVPEAAPRGRIVSRSGSVLAGDVAVPEVSMSLQSAQEHPQVVARLAALLGTTTQALDVALKSNQFLSYQPVPLATDVPTSTIVYISEHARSFPGVVASDTYERRYPQGPVGSQLIGYVGPITQSQLAADSRDGYTSDTLVGQTGLEQQYDSALQGKPGSVTDEVDAAGTVVKSLSQTPGRPGDTVVTNISLGLEQQLQADLARQVHALRTGQTTGGVVPATWGAGVVLDVHDGAVLAMASYPTYNDNDWVPYISTATYDRLAHEEGNPFNDYALVGAEPPGSTFKIATATAALDDGLITPSTVIDDQGTYTIGTTTLHDAPGPVIGPVNVVSAIAASSDVFFYTMGGDFWEQRQRYGLTPIQDMAAKYGLGEPSGIDLPNVAVGQVDSPGLRKLLHREYPQTYPSTAYYAGDNVEMAFGQGETLLTPIEMANAYATFANGGTRYAPEVAAAIESPSGSLVRRIAPKVVDHVPLPATTYQAMLAGFQGAVSNPIGTAYGIFLGFDFAKWNLAGKTGTATITHTSQPVGWFVAFGGPKGQPAEYAFCVEIYAAGYGDAAAAPVVRELADYLMSHPVKPVVLGKASRP